MTKCKLKKLSYQRGENTSMPYCMITSFLLFIAL